MLTEPAKNYILSLSDEALGQYIMSGTDVYEPEAIEYAGAEFERRDLDPDLIAQLEQTISARLQQRADAVAEAASRPLDFWEKACALIYGVFHIPFFFEWLGYDMAGQNRRARQHLRYGCLGTILLYGLLALFWWLFR